MIKKAVKKRQVSKPASKEPKASQPGEIVTFVLESGVQIPRRGHDAAFDEKIMNLGKQMKVGQSFVLPINKKNTTSKIFKHDFKEYQMRFVNILPDKKFVRMHRLK